VRGAAVNAVRLLVRILGSLALVAGLAVLLVAVIGVVRIITYESADDADHLEAKQDYLKAIAAQQTSQRERPNIIVLLFDDLGYGDLSSYGSQSIATPRIDALAAGGLRLDNYYAPSPVCTSSRAALLTGRYAPRAGLNIVAFPTGDPIELSMRAQGTLATRLPAEEIMLSEILQAAGYETGMVGKWHLGDQSPSRPMDRGHDRYVGALYSNDMTPFAIYSDDEIIHEAPFDQTKMKEVYEGAALDFIDQDRDRPFFLYVAHNFPHIPLFAPDADLGRSKGGLYGDVVEGLDDTVGAIVTLLERRGELEDTLILVTSDNGPWYEGNPGPVRGRKNQTWEGGMRVPFIAHWPARIAPGRESDAPVVGVDLVPTLLALLGLPAPNDRILDGSDVGPHLFDEDEPPERWVQYWGTGGSLDAIRGPRFKYHRRRGVRGVGTEYLSVNLPQGPWLFDLERDPNESYDVSERYPEDAARLAAAYQSQLESSETNLRGWR
jgi:arylsulfatase A-like enzyme